MMRWQWAVIAATMCLGTGIWLMLPRYALRGRAVGTLLAVVGLGLFGTLGAWAGGVCPVGGVLENTLLTVVSVVTVTSATATITFRKPVYSAIWFAITLLGSSGLLLFAGAQFLSLATVTVYAGAILVMFLFVLMLANPEGRAYYDRVSWEPLISAAAGAAVVGVLAMTLAAVFLDVPVESQLVAPAGPDELAQGVLADQHMAHLGRELFSTYLLAVEVAGTLLLAALVGAVSVLLPRRGGPDPRRAA